MVSDDTFRADPDYRRRYEEHTSLFLSLGLKLFPLHFPIASDGNLLCSCGKTECKSIGKHPFSRFAPNGHKNATADPAPIALWINSAPINLGIATGAPSGIIALDIDPRHGGDDSLLKLEQLHGPIPPTWRFLTGGGGEHILFRHPGFEVASSVATLAQGIDVRGDGGYIVAPPSRHASGQSYVVSVDHHPEDTPLAEAPAWLIKMLREPRDTAGQPRDWRSEILATCAEGQRNNRVAQLTGHLLRKGVDPHATLELLQGWNLRHCAPPLSESEVAKTVRSIAAREAKRRGGGHAR